MNEADMNETTNREAPEHSKKAEVEIEDIRERMDVAVRYASNRGVTLKEAAEAVNEALAILRQGEGPEVKTSVDPQMLS